MMRNFFGLRWTAALMGIAGATLLVSAQSPRFSALTRSFITMDDPQIALTHVRVVDGTGAPARTDQTIVIRDGMIAAVGPAASTPAPPSARIVDLNGRTAIPGLVMVHEHMFYPAGAGSYNELPASFPRLYLAGGVTTMRTGGSMAPYADLNIRKAIEAGV